MTRALQQKIHIGCRSLGLDAEQRRELQLVVTGKASMKEMNEADLKRVLKRLQNDGFKTAPKRSGFKPAPRADLRLVHKLWSELGKAGQLKDKSRKGLNTFIRAQFAGVWGSVPADVDMLRDHRLIDDVIQALKAWGQRADIDFDWSDHQRRSR